MTFTSQTASSSAGANPDQRIYARIAGVSYLAALTLAIAGGLILSRIEGPGDFARTAARIAASERLYRLALSMSLCVTSGSVLLAFALYVTLRPVNRSLAQLAMIFSLCDSVLAFFVRSCSFVRLHLYLAAATSGSMPTAPATPVPLPHSLEQLSGLLRTFASTTESIGGILFGLGSCLFFYLFFRSRYLPPALSTLGLVASTLWTSLYGAALIFPEHHPLFQSICFPPMVLAEVATGLYLSVYSVDKDRPLQPASTSSAINL